MARTQTLTFKCTVSATASDVYRAFTNSSTLREWFCDVALADARRGGRFYAAWNGGFYASGEYVSLAPNKKIVLTWFGRSEPAPTRVQVSIAEKKGRTVVTVAQSGVGSGQAWAKAIQEIKRGWEQGLENLRSALETGEDLRLSRRPMLGVSLSDFGLELAKRLGVPVAEGVRLDGTIEGMGARAAGLQKDDVIVGLAGKTITGVPSLTSALQGRRGGDKITVKFYRGQKLNTVAMELSRRPLPPIPATPAELSEAVRNTYAELDAELERCFDGVTEAEASFRPAPGEWSAKDVLCHLLAGERDGHAYVGETILGLQRYYDGSSENVEARHTALLAVFPTYRALLGEYKRAEAETVALMAAIPSEVTARRSSWWQMCFNWLQPPIHSRAHFDQIRAAIAAARQK